MQNLYNNIEFDYSRITKKEAPAKTEQPVVKETNFSKEEDFGIKETLAKASDKIASASKAAGDVAKKVAEKAIDTGKTAATKVASKAADAGKTVANAAKAGANKITKPVKEIIAKKVDEVKQARAKNDAHKRNVDRFVETLGMKKKEAKAYAKELGMSEENFAMDPAKKARLKRILKRAALGTLVTGAVAGGIALQHKYGKLSKEAENLKEAHKAAVKTGVDELSKALWKKKMQAAKLAKAAKPTKVIARTLANLAKKVKGLNWRTTFIKHSYDDFDFSEFDFDEAISDAASDSAAVAESVIATQEAEQAVKDAADAVADAQVAEEEAQEAMINASEYADYDFSDCEFDDLPEEVKDAEVKIAEADKAAEEAQLAVDTAEEAVEKAEELHASYFGE